MTLAAVALLLVVAAVAAPLLPRPSLPSMPGEARSAEKLPEPKAGKFGAATTVLEAPERVRAQEMAKCDPANAVKGSARLEATGRFGSGPAVQPSDDTVKRLTALLNDSRTVADPRAAAAETTWVVRLVRQDQKVDVMVDPTNDRLVVAVDCQPVGSYGIAGLHREFADLGSKLFVAKKP